MKKMVGLLLLVSICNVSFAGQWWSSPAAIDDSEPVNTEECSFCRQTVVKYFESCTAPIDERKGENICPAIMCDECEQKRCAKNELYYSEGKDNFFVAVACAKCNKENRIYSAPEGRTGQGYINQRARLASFTNVVDIEGTD